MEEGGGNKRRVGSAGEERERPELPRNDKKVRDAALAPSVHSFQLVLQRNRESMSRSHIPTLPPRRLSCRMRWIEALGVDLRRQAFYRSSGSSYGVVVVVG